MPTCATSLTQLFYFPSWVYLIVMGHVNGEITWNYLSSQYFMFQNPIIPTVVYTLFIVCTKSNQTPSSINKWWTKSATFEHKWTWTLAVNFQPVAVCLKPASDLSQVSLRCRAPEVSQCVFQSYEAVLKNWEKGAEGTKKNGGPDAAVCLSSLWTTSHWFAVPDTLVAAYSVFLPAPYWFFIIYWPHLDSVST